MIQLCHLGKINESILSGGNQTVAFDQYCYYSLSVQNHAWAKRFIFVALLWLLFLISPHAGASSLDFPDLDLSSSPQSIRAWAEAHQYKKLAPTEPYDEAYQREYTDGVPERHILSFVTDRHGLKALAFEQFGGINVPAVLRRDIVHRFGKPSADQIVGGKTLRITFPLEHSEAARRTFLIGRQQLSMLLMTDAFYEQMKGDTEKEERAQKEAQQRAKAAADKAELEARFGWLIPIAWATGIAIIGFALIQVLPSGIRRPVVRVLSLLSGGLINFGIDVFDQIFPIVIGLLIFGMMIFSGLAVGSGALEWGTSWWWGLLWVSGFAMLLKADTEMSLGYGRAFLTLGLFVASTAGVLIQHSWPIF